MTGEANRPADHVYVYGVARSAHSAALSPAAAEGVVPGRPIQLFSVGGLAAIISVFPTELVTHKAGIDETAWAKSRAVAHHQVLAALTGCFPLAPFKFGTILSSLDGLIALMKQNAAAFEETLDRVAGCREWGLKLFGDLSISREMAQSAPALAPLRKELTCASPGKAYLLRKKLQSAVEAEAQSALAARAVEAHRSLNSSARESAHLRHSRSPKTAAGPNALPMLLNTAYLVEDARQSQFHEMLAAMRNSFGQVGLSDVLTGPWPPYNFVSLSAAGTGYVQHHIAEQ